MKILLDLARARPPVNPGLLLCLRVAGAVEKLVVERGAVFRPDAVPVAAAG